MDDGDGSDSFPSSRFSGVRDAVIIGVGRVGFAVEKNDDDARLKTFKNV